ncbi:MAG TPA: L-alanine-DL-glutamate epimerase, partial [Spirochaetia bacterium]|nr:L-alanine-DL-glutamate epimerase [Spirochaetia bacterium]
MKIIRARSRFERLELAAPFGFKGQYVREVWQSVVLLEEEGGTQGMGLGIQSALWSDSDIFSKYGENSSNCLMFLMTDFAVREIDGMEFDTPQEFFESLLPRVYEYGQKVTTDDQLSVTFALNALVPVDTALWQLYGRQKQVGSFDEMVPKAYRAGLSARHTKLAAIPLVSYGLDEAAISEILSEGSFVLKVKIGADPEKDGDVEKMLAWDKARLSTVHRLARNFEVPYTDSGRVLYYLDANGRYPSLSVVEELLKHAEREGALERIVILE